MKNLIIGVSLVSLLIASGCSVSTSATTNPQATEQAAPTTTPSPTPTPTKEDELKQIVQEINDKNYTEAKKTMSNSNFYQNSPLLDYVIALEYEPYLGQDFFNHLNNIPSDYNEAFADDIHKMQDKYLANSKMTSDEREMKRIVADINSKHVLNNPSSDQVVIKDKPSIGMTAQQVKDNRWGSPKKVNRTTTAYGTDEQWVYDNGYVYLTDGIVTAIQD